MSEANSIWKSNSIKEKEFNKENKFVSLWESNSISKRNSILQKEFDIGIEFDIEKKLFEELFDFRY